MSARRYLAVIQAAEGYPAPGEPLEAAPPDGPAQPIIHQVVLADEYERHVGHLLEHIHGNEHAGEAAGCEKCAALMAAADA